MSSTKPPLAELRAGCQALCAGAGAPVFLRRCAQSGFLFVSGLPRHASPAALEAAVNALTQGGFVCQAPQNQEVLFIDASLGRYEGILRGLPLAPPPLPQDDALHPAHALCRLLLSRHAPLEAQPIAPLRRLLKLTESGSASPVLQAIPSLHQEAALAMRQRQPLAHAGGRVLAAWLLAQL